MTIHSFWLQQLPKKLPNGIYVVIDVWGATTNLATMLNQKPQHIFVTNKRQLPSLLKKYPHAVTIGESLKGDIQFNISNFPNDVEAANLKDQIIAFSTTAGTKALEKLRYQQLVICCAFNNVSAVAKFLRRRRQPVIIITAGEPEFTAQEDEFGKDVLIMEIKKQSYSWHKLKQQIKRHIIANEQSHYQHIPGHQITPHLRRGIDTLLQRNKYTLIPILQENPQGLLEIKTFQS